MTKNISGERSRESQPGEGEWLPLTRFRGRKGLITPRFRKTLKSYSGAMCSRSAIGFGGVRGSDTSSRLDIQALDFGVVDAAMTSREGGSPRADGEIFSFDRQGPSGIELYDIRPANGDLFYRVGDNNSLVAKAYFGPEQKDINTSQYGECDADTRHFASYPTLVKSRPDEESAEYGSNSCKDEVGVRTVALSVIHTAILSHLTADSIKAVS